MDKPRIVGVSEKKSVDGRPGSLPAPSPQENVDAPKQELSDLEKSILDEVKKRGETFEEPEEWNTGKQEEKQPEMLQPEPTQPQPTETAAQQPAQEPKAEEITPQELVVEDDRDIPVPRPRIIKRVLPEIPFDNLAKRKIEQAARDILPVENPPGMREKLPEQMTPQERESIAEEAQRKYQEKQSEQGFFHKLKRRLGFQ